MNVIELKSGVTHVRKLHHAARLFSSW